jgi:hypothetical protein
LLNLVCILVVILTSLAEPATLATTTLLFLAHVASWLGFLDFDWLTENFERLLQASIDCRLAVKCDESEASWSASVFVHHESGINDSTKLHEVLLKILLCGLLTDAANKDLASALLLVTWNGPLGVDLNIG